MPVGKGEALDAALAFTAAFLGFAFLYHPMASTPLVPGIDGPYYVVQVRWLLTHGQMKYPDPPLAFYLMSVAALVLGDIFVAVEVTSALVTALAALPTYALIKRVTGSRIAAFASALAISLNPFVVRLSSDFMKNSMGLLWLTLFLYFNARYIDRGSKADLFGLIASLVLTALTHILDYGVALLYATLGFLFARGEYRRRAAPGAAMALLSVLALVMAPFVVGGDIWKGFAFLEELAEEAEIGFIKLDWLALSVGVSASLLIASFFVKESAILSLLSASSGVIGLALNLPFIPPKWLFRFRLMTAVPLAHGVGVATAVVKDGYRPAVAALLLALVVTMGLGAYRVVRPSIPPPAYAELKAALEKLEEVGLKPVIPDTRLRYWAETLSDDVYKRARDLGEPYAIVALKTARRLPRGAPVFEGKFIIAVVPRAPGIRAPRP